MRASSGSASRWSPHERVASQDDSVRPNARRKKSARERREQAARATARTISRLVSATAQLSSHRGNAPSNALSALAARLSHSTVAAECANVETQTVETFGDPIPPRPLVRCWNFPGNCRYGDACRYAHMDPIDTPSTGATRGLLQPDTLLAELASIPAKYERTAPMPKVVAVKVELPSNALLPVLAQHVGEPVPAQPVAIVPKAETDDHAPCAASSQGHQDDGSSNEVPFRPTDDPPASTDITQPAQYAASAVHDEGDLTCADADDLPLSSLAVAAAEPTDAEQEPGVANLEPVTEQAASAVHNLELPMDSETYMEDGTRNPEQSGSTDLSRASASIGSAPKEHFAVQKHATDTPTDTVDEARTATDIHAKTRRRLRSKTSSIGLAYGGHTAAASSQVDQSVAGQRTEIALASTATSASSASAPTQLEIDELQVKVVLRNAHLQLVRTDGMKLQHLDDVSKSSRVIVTAAVTQCGMSLQFASEALKNDNDILMIAVTQNGMALQHANAIKRDNPALVRAAAKSNGYSLQFASKRRRTDPAYVKIALQQILDASHLNMYVPNDADIAAAYQWSQLLSHNTA